MAKLIGAAGHVDHGKTTLIRALTGIDADRLPEEKRRGMTIEIGFAYLDSPNHGRVSIVDVPGHEKFIGNMLVGALGFDVALLCVAADAGVAAQTLEHFQILECLPVEKMVVALTKADLVDEGTVQLASAEVEDLLKETRFEGARVVPVSAVSGAGLEELKQALETALDETATTEQAGGWYLPVDRVFTVKGQGVVVTGTLARGELKVGDVGFLQPGGFEVRVRGLHVHGESVESSERGRRTAVNLGGVSYEDVRRGMTFGHADSLFQTTAIEVKMRWLDRPKHASTVRVSIGSEEAIGRVFHSKENPEFATVKLAGPIGATKGQPVVLRRASPMRLLGGGIVSTPQAATSKRSKTAAPREGLSDEDAILSMLEGQIHGVETAEIARRLGRTPQALGNVFERLLKRQKALGFAGLWFDPAAFGEAYEQLKSALQHLHEKEPQRAGQTREKAVQAARLPWTGKPLDRIISHLEKEGKLLAEGTNIRLPHFAVSLSPKQRAFLDRVIQLLDEAAPGVPGINDLARQLGVPPQAVDEILRLGIQSRELVRVAPDILYSRGGLERLIRTARANLKGPFAASDFRDAISASRKYAIPLLEYLDANRVTLRQGDNRVFRS